MTNKIRKMEKKEMETVFTDKSVKVLRKSVTQALDRVWERLLCPEGQCEFVDDHFHLMRNRQLAELALIADTLKIVLLSVRYTTWKQLVMAIRIWECEQAGAEDLIWEAERQILGPVAEMLSNGVIRLEEPFDAVRLAEEIKRRGDNLFVDASEEVWSSIDGNTLGPEKMALWAQSEDWELYRRIRQEDAYRQSKAIASSLNS